MRENRGLRFGVIFTILVIGVLMVLVVWCKASCADLQYQINQSKATTSEVEREIEDLEVKIRTANNINNLEARALEIGLVYPDFDCIEYLDSEEDTDAELALALKETVYRQ